MQPLGVPNLLTARLFEEGMGSFDCLSWVFCPNEMSL